MGLPHGREQSLNYFPQISYLHLPLFDTLWSYAESIELFLETRLSRDRMIQLLAHLSPLPSPARKLSLFLSLLVCVARSSLLTGGGARMPGPL